jgi:hypothetical protein
MAKATVPETAISAFQAAGLLPSSDGEKYDRQFDPGQTKRVGHWHGGSYREGWFGREENREINLKWKYRLNIDTPPLSILSPGAAQSKSQSLEDFDGRNSGRNDSLFQID